MGNKIYITGCAGIPARYGGFETFAECISKELINNHEVHVFCSTKLYGSDERKMVYKGVKRQFIPISANGIQSLLYDFIAVLKAARKADTILQLGSGSGIVLLLLKPFIKGKLFIHTDGLEWRRKKWNVFTRCFLFINVYISYLCCTKILIDNPVLVEAVPRKYRKKIIHAGYGGDHIPVIKRDIHKPAYALAIARAEVENNLHILLEAFKSINDHRIIIISNWKKTSYGRQLYHKYYEYSNIELVQAIYDDLFKLQYYRVNCTIYFHGHSTGGTNPSLVEAMYSGIPVVAHDNPYNRATTKNSALYFRNSEDIVSLLKNSNDRQLAEVSCNMKEIARKEYLWEKVSNSLIDEIS